MKPIQSILALATFSLVACGGMSDEDIRKALNNAEPAQESTLQFKFGETWTGTRVAKSVNGIPYKFEGGVSTLCSQGAAGDGATTCGTPAAGTSIRTTLVNATVLGRSDTAITELPGWAVQEVNTVTTDDEIFFAAAGTYSTLNNPNTSKETQLYTLAEKNNFVIRIDEDQANLDSTGGRAIYPSHPQRGRTYTDDTGMSWTVTGATRVPLAKGTVAAAAVSATTTIEQKIDPASLATFKEKCFFKRSAGANFTVEVRGECLNPLVVKNEVRVEIGHDLALRQTTRVETLEVTDYGIRDAGGNLSQTLPNSVTGDFVFLYDIFIEEETFTMSDIVIP